MDAAGAVGGRCQPPERVPAGNQDRIGGLDPIAGTIRDSEESNRLDVRVRREELVHPHDAAVAVAARSGQQRDARMIFLGEGEGKPKDGLAQSAHGDDVPGHAASVETSVARTLVASEVSTALVAGISRVHTKEVTKWLCWYWQAASTSAGGCCRSS